MFPAIDELGIDENGCIKGTLCNESRLEEFHKACMQWSVKTSAHFGFHLSSN